MKFQNQITDDRLLAELGTRLARIRLEKNLPQDELAREAGIGLRTLQRLETGAVATRLSAFLRVCRVLGLLERFELLVPEAGPSPMAQLKLQGKKRRRASQRPVVSEEAGSWKWGDET